MLYGFGQDALTCMAQGGIPTADGRCVSKDGGQWPWDWPTVPSDPRKAACEVQGSGYRWDPVAQVCLPPSMPQPAYTSIAEAVARAACAAMGGQWLLASNECQTMNRKYGINEFQTVALPPGECPPDQVRTPEGCFPYPGGVKDQPPVQPPSQPPPEETPAWVLPTVLGVGAIALVAVVVSVSK